MALEATPEPPLPAVMDRKTQIACNVILIGLNSIAPAAIVVGTLTNNPALSEVGKVGVAIIGGGLVVAAIRDTAPYMRRRVSVPLFS